jgi:hypothetical protein
MSQLPNANYQISKMLTHFFVLQKVLPHRIQQKYFQMIKFKLLDRIKVLSSRAKNGIFVPCNKFYDPTLALPNNLWSLDALKSNALMETERYRHKECTVPSPFVMSKDIRACVMHQKCLQIMSFTIDKIINKQNASSKVSESE